jgi:2-polyprenyl-3-methyl-5-hydroxy-6-metoxy-1,4-benzoquinol methylase
MVDNTLVKILGFPATLIQGDFLVIDRWKWIKERLQSLPKGSLIDIGCGAGAFSIGAGKVGFDALGLSWDEKNQHKASERARIAGVADKVKFEILDVRNLDSRKDLINRFDVAICAENIEHIINDKKLIRDIANTLKPNGTLLLTTPNYNYVPMGIGDSKEGIKQIEDGGHVRIGYTPEDCYKVCEGSGLTVTEISYCSGFMSQKLTAFQRGLSKLITYYPAWALTLPLRIFPLILDKQISKLFKWPGYSICMVARKTKQ